LFPLHPLDSVGDEYRDPYALRSTSHAFLREGDGCVTMAWPEMTFDGLSGRRGPPRPDLQSRVRSPTTPEEHGASEHRASCADRTCACAAMSRRGV